MITKISVRQNSSQTNRHNYSGSVKRGWVSNRFFYRKMAFLDHPNQLDTWAYARGFDYAVQEQWASPYEGKRYDEQMHWINGKQDSIYF